MITFGHYILMSHQKYRKLVRVLSLPLVKQTGLADHLLFHGGMDRRKNLLQILMEFFKLTKIHFGIIRIGNGRNPNHSLQMLHIHLIHLLFPSFINMVPESNRRPERPPAIDLNFGNY